MLSYILVSVLKVISCVLGVDSFLMYSIHEGIRGMALEPNDNSEALMPITGTLFAVGVDFHAGEISFNTESFSILASDINCKRSNEA